MRKLGIGLLISLLLVGCQPAVEEPLPATPEATVESVGHKRLRYMEPSDPPSLHGWYAVDERSQLLIGNLQSGLFNMNPAQEVVADLVQTMNVSEDGLEYHFTLKPNHFVSHRGEVLGPVRAQDFVYSWKELANPVNDSPHQDLIMTAGIKGSAQLQELKFQLESLERLERRLADLEMSEVQAQDGPVAWQNYRNQEQALKAERDELVLAFETQYGSVAEAQAQLQTMVSELGVYALDEQTLVLELERPVPFLTELLALPAFFPVSEELHRKLGPAYASDWDSSAFSGAFYLKQWEPGRIYQLQKNEHYWDQSAVTLESVELIIDPDMTNESRVEQYFLGNIDWAILTGENIDKYGNRPDTWYRLDASVVYIEVNQGLSPDRKYRQFLRDPETRKALHMALDKVKLTDVILNNGSIAADTLYPRSFQQLKGRDIRLLDTKYSDGYNLFDSDQALEKWQAAKQRAGLDWVVLELLIPDTPNAEKVAGFLKAEWERLLSGVTIEIRAENAATKLELEQAQQYQLSLSAWTPDYPDVLSYAEHWLSYSGYNTTCFSQPEYDELVHSAKSGPSAQPGREQERMLQLLEAERLLLADYQVILPLYQRGAIHLLNPSVRNLVVQIVGPQFQFKYVELE